MKRPLEIQRFIKGDFSGTNPSNDLSADNQSDSTADS